MHRLLIILSLITPAAMAGPVITKIGPHPDLDGVYIIEGSGFGEYADENTDVEHLNLAWENFETGKIGRSVNIAGTGPRISTGGKEGSKYHAVSYRWKKPITYINVKGETKTSTRMYGLRTAKSGLGTKRLFLSAWFSIEDDFKENISKGNNLQSKVMMMSPGDNKRQTSFTFRTQLQTSTEDGQLQQNHGAIDELLPPGKWHRLDIISDIPKGVKWYVNGKLIRSATYSKDKPPGSFSRAGWTQYQFSGSNEYPWYQCLDDLYVSKTPARVELSTSPVWDETQESLKSLQIPIAWNDSAIAVRGNPGNIPLDRELYVYVIDDNGEVSNPYMVDPRDPEPPVDPPVDPIDPPVHPLPDPPTDCIRICED